MAGGVAIDQGAKTNLMGNALTSQSFCDDPKHDPEHGCAAVEPFNPPELLSMDLLLSFVLAPLFRCLRWGHGMVKGRVNWVGMRR